MAYPHPTREGGFNNGRVFPAGLVAQGDQVRVVHKGIARFKAV